MRGPLLIAAIVVVARVAAERVGLPVILSSFISAVALHLLIMPIYFAIRIGSSDIARPYLGLLKATGLYALAVRVMVVPTYWLAYLFQWPDPRFSVQNAGVVGPDVTAVSAFVLVPLSLTISWVVGSVIVGGGIAALVLVLRRRSRASLRN